MCACGLRGRVMAAAVVAVGAGMARADLIGISGSVGNSTEQTGATFSGTISYTFISGSLGALEVFLMNDSPANVGGFLTGFVFNIDSADPLRAATLTGTTDPDFLDTGVENGAPFGTFDAGAALGANWEGGGSPNNGLGIGASGTFMFDVTASDAASLSAASFVNGANEFNFVVRFKGLRVGQGSDKVPVPGPGGVALLVAAGAMGVRRRARGA
ncbi:MAG: hypothetical protein H6811_01850 [Phycisphaeraceae bacterium]|nr:hypothetical protein [Phycisphaeraceae bacterium]